MMRILLAVLLLTGPGARPDPQRLRILSEKLALDLVDSKRCEVIGGSHTACRYNYEGLTFTRRIFTEPFKHAFVDIEALESGAVTVQVYGDGPCISIQASPVGRPEDIAVAHMNVKDGRIAADAQSVGCLRKGTPK
jgi:hypothetical protein